MTQLGANDNNYLVDEDTDCWIWQGALNNKGYGPHRRIYERLVGPIPAGLIVCHRCDNPPCVNPKHLFLGTYSDNMVDCVTKGRYVVGDKRGSKNVNSKLTEFDVKEIKSIWEEGHLTQEEIADMFGVTQPTVWKILSGRAWKHVL